MKKKAEEVLGHLLLQKPRTMPHYVLSMRLLWLKNLADDAAEACEEAGSLAENIEKNMAMLKLAEDPHEQCGLPYPIINELFRGGWLCCLHKSVVSGLGSSSYVCVNDVY